MKPNQILIPIYHRRAEKSMCEKRKTSRPFSAALCVCERERGGALMRNFRKRFCGAVGRILSAKKASGNQKFIIKQELII